MTQGGASGAFFFYSKDEAFLCKSCTKEEFITIVENAEQFADYYESESGRESLISKIYGLYMMRIYATDIYFFVMANLFYSEPMLAIHEKYDIKGSTVNRNALPPKEGQSYNCKHCEQRFTYFKSVPKRLKELSTKTFQIVKPNDSSPNPSNVNETLQFYLQRSVYFP